MKKVRLKRSPLKKTSKAYAKDLGLYHRSTKPMWLENHPNCEFELVVLMDDGYAWKEPCRITWGCTVHHMKGRGKYLNDMRYFMTVCQHHHALIEDNKKEARKLGYILYK